MILFPAFSLKVTLDMKYVMNGHLVKQFHTFPLSISYAWEPSVLFYIL